MKIKVVSSKDEIKTLKTDDRIIHLAFRPSSKDVMALVSLYPGIQAIHLPHSYKKTLSESIQMFLEMHNIALLEGDVWGHRKDISEYFEIPQEVIDTMNELKRNHVSTENIALHFRDDVKLSTDLVRFILNA